MCDRSPSRPPGSEARSRWQLQIQPQFESKSPNSMSASCKAVTTLWRGNWSKGLKQVDRRIEVENPRPTASIKDLRVLRRPEGMDYMEEGTFQILTTFATPPVTFDLVMDASRITGMEV